MTLRAGLNATVNVASDTAGDPSPGITIIGAANSDVINLGPGNDTVTLGAGETVNSGGGNNSFNVAAATLGSVTINGGTTGTNTLTITSGGTATMGAGITGIATVRLTAATTFTANATPGLQIIGSTGADKITAGGANQVLTGGTGADTLTGSSAGNDIFRDTAAGLNGDTIANLLASDVIDITNLAPATAVITSYQVSAAKTVLTLTDGTNSTTITLSGADYGSFALAADSSGGTDLTFVPNASLSTFTLPTHAGDHLGRAGEQPSSSRPRPRCSAGDSITGGTGTGVSNQLLLSGGGAFNLAALTKLANIQVITAQEGEGATAQTVTLRAGLNATVNVASDTATGDPSPGITIIGAANSDVINLGSGNDTVTPGAGETVNSGGGNDTYNVTAATIGSVTINGGSGTNTLVADRRRHWHDGQQDHRHRRRATGGADHLHRQRHGRAADQRQQRRRRHHHPGRGDAERDRRRRQRDRQGHAANAGAVGRAGSAPTARWRSPTAAPSTLNAATDVGTVKLDAASTLVLNGMQFITAIGSTGADTIEAGATNQTLTSRQRLGHADRLQPAATTPSSTLPPG